VFKRITWMGTGIAVGAGGAFWAKRKVEATVARYLPDRVADRAATQARDLGRTVRTAASEGRDAMRQREQELRAQVEERTFVGPVERQPPTSVSPEPVRRGARRTTRTPATPLAPSMARRRSRR